MINNKNSILSDKAKPKNISEINLFLSFNMKEIAQNTHAVKNGAPENVILFIWGNKKRIENSKKKNFVLSKKK